MPSPIGVFTLPAAAWVLCTEPLGIAETTVRTHLHRTYQKTGTRQADLVKLVAAFSDPLLK